MSWKMDGDNLAIENGNPVLIGGDGIEKPIADNFISDLNNEAATRRREANELKTKLSAFDGIDAGEAIKALETTKNLDLSKMVDKGQLDEVRTAVAEQFQEKVDKLTESLSGSEGQIRQLLVTNAFASSKFISDETVLLPEFAESHFANAFKIEDGQAVAYQNGQPILSMENAGKNAGFEEAIRILVKSHPQSDSIMKGSGASGGGSQQNNGGGGSKTMADYSPADLVTMRRTNPQEYEQLKKE